MQEKESIMVVRCELKISSLGITAPHHLTSLVMPNSYPRDGTFNPHLTTIKDSYNLNKVNVKAFKIQTCKVLVTCDLTHYPKHTSDNLHKYEPHHEKTCLHQPVPVTHHTEFPTISWVLEDK